MTNYIRGLVFIFLSALAFGSYGVWSRLIGTSLGLFYPGWTRSLFITVLLLPFLIKSRRIVSIKKKDWMWMAVYLLCTSLTQAPIFYAFNRMDIGSATLLFFVSMLLTMYSVGFLFLGEKTSTVKIISFIIAILGLYTTFSFSITVFALLAAVAAVLNGIASGGEVSFSKKLSGSYSTLYLTWLSWLVIAISNGAISIAIGEVQHLPTISIIWLYQICYAVVGLLGFWFIIEGLKYVEASTGGLLGLLEIVFSIAFGITMFHEVLTSKIAVGAFLIIMAAALPHLVDAKQKIALGQPTT